MPESKGDSRLDRQLPTAERETHPSTLCILPTTSRRIGIAALGGRDVFALPVFTGGAVGFDAGLSKMSKRRQACRKLSGVLAPPKPNTSTPSSRMREAS